MFAEKALGLGGGALRVLSRRRHLGSKHHSAIRFNSGPSIMCWRLLQDGGASASTGSCPCLNVTRFLGHAQSLQPLATLECHHQLFYP